MTRARLTPAVFTLMCGIMAAQNFSIQPFAGVPRQTGDGGPAVNAALWSPRGVSVDESGNLYIADSGNSRVRRVTADGIIATVAGSTAGSSGDNGDATSAQLSLPTHAVFGPTGDMYIVDAGNRRIRKVSASGKIANAAGPRLSESDANLSLVYPRDVAVDKAGNMYIADLAASRVWKVTPNGQGSVFAGTGIIAFYGDGLQAASATLALPRGVAVDTATGTVYIADTNNNRIRKVDPSGIISTIAGATMAGFAGDGGPASVALLNAPSAVAVAGGNIYIADTGNNRIRRIDPQGNITTVAGSGVAGFGGDNGSAAGAILNQPEGVAVDKAGAVYIADTGNHRIRRVSGGVIATVAGVDRASGDNGPALEARLFQPAGLALDGSGSLYIADSANNRIRKVTSDGRITTIAGTGVPGYSAQATVASTAQLKEPGGLAIGPSGNLYVADTGNHVVRMITPGGSISTVAGTGEVGNKGDGGPAVAAILNSPAAVAFDASGRLFIADSGNNRIRVVDLSGTIQPYAGDHDGTAGYADGTAASALFSYPRGLAFAANGDLYVADFFNNRIRRVSPDGAITTYAGTGVRGNADGPRMQAQFSLPSGLAFDPRSGTLYVADSLNDRIRMIGSTGAVTTAAGSGGEGDSGDGGQAVLAQLDYPRGVVVDNANGTVYFSDQDNDRVRKLTGAEPPQITSVTNSASFAAGAVAPGEIVTIKGTQLLSPTGATEVVFDGMAAPILFASATQINVIVPNEVADRGTSMLVIRGNGSPFVSQPVTVQEAAIGIFTTSQNGTGQAAAVNNADNSVNSASTPAARGSYVQLYVTGGGLIPGLGTGQSASVAMKASLAFRVQIGGISVAPIYAGAAPGFPGLMQVNVQVPSGVTPGPAVPVIVSAGASTSQSATIAVGP